MMRGARKSMTLIMNDSHSGRHIYGQEGHAAASGFVGLLVRAY
jgi:hypothetical protein